MFVQSCFKICWIPFFAVHFWLFPLTPQPHLTSSNNWSAYFLSFLPPLTANREERRRRRRRGLFPSYLFQQHVCHAWRGKGKPPQHIESHGFPHDDATTPARVFRSCIFPYAIERILVLFCSFKHFFCMCGTVQCSFFAFYFPFPPPPPEAFDRHKNKGPRIQLEKNNTRKAKKSQRLTRISIDREGEGRKGEERMTKAFSLFLSAPITAEEERRILGMNASFPPATDERPKDAGQKDTFLSSTIPRE